MNKYKDGNIQDVSHKKSILRYTNVLLYKRPFIFHVFFFDFIRIKIILIDKKSLIISNKIEATTQNNNYVLFITLINETLYPQQSFIFCVTT